MRRHGMGRLLAGAAAAALLVGPAAAVAQSADPELSCVPDSVVAGATTSCTVSGVAASRAVDLELRSGPDVVATADGVAGTDGTATITVTVPASTTAGTLTVALAGTGVTLVIGVEPARPSGVSAGLGPSAGDVVRTVPAAALLAAAVLLAGGALPGMRRRAGADAA